LDRLRSHLAGIGMAKQYWPEHLVVVEQLPRTPSGKVRKVELRATAMGLLGLGCTDAGGDPGMTDPAVGA
ncbi:MAG: hypothetical protein HYR89_01775, partial [Actinobacteria bacterium]|nr:hypothetical protein [Actinomycetota bacterium]